MCSKACTCIVNDIGKDKEEEEWYRLVCVCEFRRKGLNSKRKGSMGGQSLKG